ncbi:MAG: ABC-2 transporter permease [Ruminococcus sp.]|nr:ABC-2 transporter permease [Ruminococcus sp.]
MTGTLNALKLDLSLIKPYMKTMAFSLIMPVFIAAGNRSLINGISFAMCIAAMTSGYTFSVTEKNSMERLYGIIPIKKREMVMGRYGLVIFTGITALVFSLILQCTVLTLMGENIGFNETAYAAAAGIFLFSLYTVFQLPGFYLLGYIKGRLFMYIPAAGFVLTLFIFGGTNGGGAVGSPASVPPAAVTVISAAAAVLMYIFSAAVSVKILERKEL